MKPLFFARRGHGPALAVIAAAALAGACKAPVQAPLATPATCAAEAPRAKNTAPKFTGKMPGVRPTQMAQELKDIGLDPKNLPPLELVDRTKILKVMQTFTRALGAACTDCHREEDFHAENPRRRVARHMWNEMVRVLATEDGSPVYCDSCHQGRIYVLDRRDKAELATYMDDVFVGKMKRADGKDHDCGTCHGDPPEFSFLDDWRRP